MEYLVTAAQMKECDRVTIQEYGIPSMVLMERAALACTEVILERDRLLQKENMPSYRRTLIVAGCGNNGGDGLAVGRLLMQRGFSVDFCLIGKEEKCTVETAAQLNTLRKYGCRIYGQLPDKRYDIIVDALFGIGLHSDLKGIFEEAVNYINNQDAYVLSVDIPSGIHSDTGAVCGCAVQADVTVTFAFRKLGQIFYPGARYAGRVICAQMGITEESYRFEENRIFTYTGLPGFILPERNSDGNKGTFGKVSLLAGSKGMAGAAILSASAVLHAGAGMVRVISEEGNRSVMQTSVPEAMFTGYRSDVPEQTETLESLKAAFSWADVIAAGPGLGTGTEAKNILTYVIENCRCPLVLDADAINLLSENRTLLKRLEELQNDPESRRELILTPHPGELARLEQTGIGEVKKASFEITMKWAKQLHAAVICKGARTVIAGWQGDYFLNTSGNSGMATAGSGDVLTGIIAAFSAQGMDSFHAAWTGAYIHGCAGDSAAHRKNEYSMTAGDLVSELDAVM